MGEKVVASSCRTLFLSGIVLFVLISFPLINSVGASSEMWNQTYGGTGGTNDDLAFHLVETSDGGFALAGYTQSVSTRDYDFWLVRTNPGVIPEFPDEENSIPTTEPFPITWVVVAIVIVAVVGAALLVYFKKIKKTTEKAKKIMPEGVK